MTTNPFPMFLVGIISLGCATPTHKRAGSPAAADMTRVVQTAYDEESSADISQPQELAADASKLTVEEVRDEPSGDNLTIDSAVALALSSSPAIRQAESRIEALRGQWVQVGLPPNPSAGYLASEVGSEGTAGQQGGYVGQTLITAGKRQKGRAATAAEIERVEQELATTQQRVRSDVRLVFYEALLAQRRLELAESLVEITSKAVDSSQSLVEAAEIAMPGLLQTEIMQRNAVVLQTTSANELERTRRQLSNLLGSEVASNQRLKGDLAALPILPDFDTLLARVQSSSPEVATAVAELERRRRMLTLAHAQAYPDLTAQVSVQRDNATGDTLTGVQFGAPIPVWDRNQGGVREAAAGISAAARNIDRVERDLTSRLADAYQTYTSSLATAQTYQVEILPKSQRTMDLVQQSYASGESGYLNLLTAQQTYAQTNLTYLDAVGETWRNYVLIDGLLLEGSLQQRND